MKKNYPNRNIDVCLITTSDMNLGVRSLSSFLKQKGYRVTIGFFDSWGMYTPQELQSIVSWFREIDPRVIGISPVEFSRDKTIQLLAAIKREGKFVIAGGVDATLNPSFYAPYVDYIVRGEGEEALAELVSALFECRETKSIPNVLSTSESGATAVSHLRPLVQSLDILPFEDWLDVEHHFELSRGAVKQKQDFALEIDNPLVPYRKGILQFTVRGCSFDCSYCVSAITKLLNPGETFVRMRSVQAIIGRVEQLFRADPTIEMVYFFEDDFFLRSADEIREFAEGWKQRVALPFFVQGAPFTITEEKLTRLIDAGLVSIGVGIQTGSERTNRVVYNRNARNETTLKTARLLNRYIGCGRFSLRPPSYDFIINNPYEKDNDLLETVEFLKRLPKPYYTRMISLVFFQGILLYQQALRDGILTGKDESSKYNVHDTLKHFDRLVERGGHYYLNSLLYWMNGRHGEGWYGIIPAVLLDVLYSRKVVRLISACPRLIAFLNRILPTQKKVENARWLLKKRLSWLTVRHY